MAKINTPTADKATRNGDVLRAPAEELYAEEIAALVQALAVAGHAGAREFLSTLFRQKLGRAGNEYEVTEILDTMIRVGHPGATDAVTELIKKIARATPSSGYYGAYWVGRLIPSLPRAEALPKLEALLPTLPERVIDRLLDYVTELKQSTPRAAST